MNKLYRIKSDNYDCYMTPAAYKIIQLEMSTGDWHTHKKREVLFNDQDDADDYIDRLLDKGIDLMCTRGSSSRVDYIEGGFQL